MTNVDIRPAELSDITEMVGLLESLFALEEDFAFDAVKQAKGIQLLLEDDHCRFQVAEYDGRVVGMCSAQWVYSTSEGAKSAWIEDLVVAGEMRGRQIGKRLLDSVLEWSKAQGCTRAQLVYDQDNQPAIGFYRHQGWQQTNLGVFKYSIK